MISHGHTGWGWRKAISTSGQGFWIGAFQKGQHAWSREIPFEEGVSAASHSTVSRLLQKHWSKAGLLPLFLKGSSENAGNCLPSIDNQQPILNKLSDTE